MHNCNMVIIIIRVLSRARRDDPEFFTDEKGERAACGGYNSVLKHVLSTKMQHIVKISSVEHRGIANDKKGRKERESNAILIFRDSFHEHVQHLHSEKSLPRL